MCWNRTLDSTNVVMCYSQNATFGVAQMWQSSVANTRQKRYFFLQHMVVGLKLQNVYPDSAPIASLLVLGYPINVGLPNKVIDNKDESPVPLLANHSLCWFFSKRTIPFKEGVTFTGFVVDCFLSSNSLHVVQPHSQSGSPIPSQAHPFPVMLTP